MFTDQILLFSGGTDSFIAWRYLKRPPVLYVDLNTKYSVTESRNVRDLANKYKMDLTIDECLSLKDQEADDASGFVPHRNTFLSLIASFYANRIWFAGLKSDVVVDKNPEYALEMSQFLTKQLQHRARSVVVDSPFWNYTKEDTIRWLIAHEGQQFAESMLKDTFSCYSKAYTHCGECQACFRRYVALKLHGIKEDFAKDPLVGCREIIVTKYIPEMIKSIQGSGKYDFRRSIETLGLLYEPFLSNSLLFENHSLIISLLKQEKEKIVKQFGIVPNYTAPV